jgi:hypothetical protein
MQGSDPAATALQRFAMACSTPAAEGPHTDRVC